MTEAYNVSQGDTILLVGEGNFSFSKAFLISTKKAVNNFSNIKIVTSCKESHLDTFNELKQNNIKFISENGKFCISFELANKLISRD